MSMMPLSEARNHFSELLSEVESTHERVTITRHGQPIAVVLSPEDLASLEETLAFLSTPGAREAIAEGLADLEAGRAEDWAAMRDQIAKTASDKV